MDGIPLTAAHKLDDFNLRAGVHGRRVPQLALYDTAVEFNGHAFRLEAELPQNVAECAAWLEKMLFSVDRNLILL